MKYLTIIFVTIIIAGCLEVDARILQLETEKQILEQEVLVLVDSIGVLVTEQKLEMERLNRAVNDLAYEIEVKEQSFDSLMVLWNNNLMDTTYLDTLRARLLRILN